MRKSLFAGIGSIALMLAAPASSDEQCHLYRITSINMNFDEAGGVNIPMTVGGQNQNMLVDTGGIDSMLTNQAAAALGLHREPFYFVDITMYGGARVDHYVIAHDIQLGRLKAQSSEFLIIPDGFLPTGVTGLLAPDFMRAYDIDLDFANAKFSLFSRDHCDGRVVYWTKDVYAQVPFKIDEVGHITTTLQIDGKDVKATIDTGSSRSLMSLETAEELFGFDEKSPDLTALGSDGAKKHGYLYPFKVLTFPGVSVLNPDIVLVPDDVSKIRYDSMKLILGMGVLRQLHVYIAYGERNLYLTPASAH